MRNSGFILTCRFAYQDIFKGTAIKIRTNVITGKAKRNKHIKKPDIKVSVYRKRIKRTEYLLIANLQTKSKSYF